MEKALVAIGLAMKVRGLVMRPCLSFRAYAKTDRNNNTFRHDLRDQFIFGAIHHRPSFPRIYYEWSFSDRCELQTSKAFDQQVDADMDSGIKIQPILLKGHYILKSGGKSDAVAKDETRSSKRLHC